MDFLIFDFLHNFADLLKNLCFLNVSNCGIKPLKFSYDFFLHFLDDCGSQCKLLALLLIFLCDGGLLFILA
jgi:hypothetical protein